MVTTYLLTYTLLTNNVDTRDPIGSKNCMCQPMRNHGRITRSKSYKIYVSLSEATGGHRANHVFEVFF